MRFAGPLSLAAASTVLAFVLTAESAHALNAHSWVSSTGTGSTCTRSAPCGSLFTALGATEAGGVISFLDPGAADNNGASVIAISKSITLRAEGVDSGPTATQSSPVGAWITVQAGPNDVVTIDGLQLNGGGISFLSGGHLHVVRCTIMNQNVSGEAGIKFRPDTVSKLSVTDTVITNYGSGFGGGIVVNPRAGGSARVALERVTVNGNAFGVAADGTNSTDGINMTIADSMIANNAQDGIIAVTPTGGAPIGLMVTNTKSINNAIGIRSIGPNVAVRVESSKIIGNGTGLSFGSGGALLSFGNNAVQANGNSGAFSGSVALQ